MKYCLLALLVAFLLAGQSATLAQEAPSPALQPAPDFDGAESWLNTEKPISIKDLKGQVVLLDFWAYCCINCMHVFPDLHYLEKKFKDQPFVVIGVHSGKFDQEKDAEHIRNAVLRHNIAHPVAVDSEYLIWNAYGVRAWPTLVVIDPEGNVVGQVSGEGHRNELEQVIAHLLEVGAKNETLGKPLTFKQERESFKPGVLEFPGKVLADAAGKRLFIADTNHHRVLVSDLEGKVSDVIGAGDIGLKDGTFPSSQFHQPQGMTLSEDGKTLYIADTENHAIRAADLEKKTVKTIAGTGKQGYDRKPSGVGAATDLSSPWDVVRVGTTLFIAMAGTHQIWALDLDTGNTRNHAGTGRETSVDGLHPRATFSQPSGMATDGQRIYIADSEASSIRAVEVNADGATSTVAGSNELFGFGLKNGRGGEALFQHPLGVALHGDTLFVADAFNNVIRAIDLKSREVSTWLGTGKVKAAKGEGVALYEPGGISIADGVMYIADTNRHRILSVDIKSRKTALVPVKLP